MSDHKRVKDKLLLISLIELFWKHPELKFWDILHLFIDIHEEESK